MDWDKSGERIVLESAQDRDLAFDAFEVWVYREQPGKRPFHSQSKMDQLPHTLTAPTTKLVLSALELIAVDVHDQLKTGFSFRQTAYKALVGLNDARGDRSDTELKTRLRQAMEAQPSPNS